MLNDTALCVKMLNNSLDKRGLEKISIDDYRKKFLFPIKTFYESVGFDFSNETFEITNKEFHDGFEKNFKKLALQPHAFSTIKKLNSKGITQSILSATMQAKLDEQVKFFGLDIYLDNIVGLSNTPSGFGKEFEGKELLSSVDISKKETIIIGDSMLDYSVSNALNIDCGLVYNGHNSMERLAATGSKTFSNIESLSKWIIQ